MPQRRLLGIFAHPDDESRIVGGTLAKYASEGARVSLVVATRGEAGSRGEPPLTTSDELPRVRERELSEACAILGLSDLTILNYRDGTLPDVDRHELTGHLVAAIRRFKPQVIVTFGSEGRTLHPDHLVIHEAATVAFELAADSTAYPEQQLQPHAAQKLYYHVVPRSVAERVGWRFPSVPDEEVTVALDVAPWVEQKRRATYEAHRTQAHDLIFAGLSSEEERWGILSTEHFVLAATHDLDRPAYEDDLFAGIAG